jgi:hypothetical protein
LKKYINIDDPLTDLSEKIRKYYFERSKSLTGSLRFPFRRSAYLMAFQVRRLFIIVFLLLPGIKGVAPHSNTLTIFESPVIRPFSGLMYATGMVETMGNTLTYNEFENAVGIFQIRQVRIDDYNRKTGSHYSLADMFDPKLSEKVYLYFASQFKPHELERIAKAWNGSGPMTELYWKRIKEYL